MSDLLPDSRPAPGPPTGAVTFFFTDIEASVKLWEGHPEGMRDALTCHDAILRHAIVAHAGWVFKAVGDGFYAAFALAPDALLAALDAQRALLAADWGQVGQLRVRIALHTGAAVERGGDYFGPTINRVFRLMQAAHGGQILLSQATQQQVCEALPLGVGLRDLGERRLRDFEPEHIFQLVAPDLPADFPLLKTLDSRPNNLPAQLTSFIGREREVSAVCRLVRRVDVRLVTLTGAGGTGKTRLALQVAADLLNDFEDGVFFVTLAAARDPALVVSAIAQVLSVKENGNPALIENLKHYLHDRQMLLVLDNFEQVLAAGPVLTDLLAASPRLKVLVTSRALLQIYGEHEFLVPPLALPDLRHLPPLETLSHVTAVALFSERAQAVRADFALTAENAPAVAEICARLDGLPLAIELAAARCKLFSPQSMLARLTGVGSPSSLRVLTDGARDLPARQQTLRGAMDWSYNLLDVGEKKLFARLAVFVGGCTAEAAEAVCNTGRDLPMNVLDGLTSLLYKSMLQQAESVNSEPRFAMLETIREYALERLVASGETGLLRLYHAGYFLAMAERAAPELRAGPQQVAWLDRLEREHDNLRAALSWSLEQGEVEMTLRLSAALWRFWYWHSHLTEGGRWLAAALATTRDLPELASARAKALDGAGTLASALGNYKQAASLLEEGLALGRELGHLGKVSGARMLTTLGTVMFNQADYQRANALYEESLALQRELGDEVGIAQVLNNLGTVANCQGDYEQAETCLQESLARFRKLEIKWGIAYALGNLGRAALCRGDCARANVLLEESLALCREMGDRDGVAECMARLGGVAAAQGEMERAEALYREGLTLYQEVGDRPGVAECLKELAQVAEAQAEATRAAQLFGAAEVLREAIGASLLPDESSSYEHVVAALRARLGENAFASAWAQGRATTLERAIVYALKDEYTL